jgi:integrator complex subunit 9
MSMDTLASFLPCTIVPNNNIPRLSKISTAGRKFAMPGLKRFGEFTYIDATPEVHPVPLHSVAVDTIDAILVSNWLSLMALPFFTERDDFRGVVYATDPTVQLGGLVMEELIDMFERIDRSPSDGMWKRSEIWGGFFNPPCTDPNEWKPFYTRKQMENALAKVTHLSFQETVVINGVIKCSAYSSGYAIGTCNWVLETEHEKIGYLSASSSRSSHIKPVQWEYLRNMDALILTSMCRFPESQPSHAVHKLVNEVTETLKKGGNVLIPITPTGVIYDLFECVVTAIEKESISRDVPIYFISNIADSSLAYSNIFAEYLSEKKSSKVYLPEEPFVHGEVTAI